MPMNAQLLEKQPTLPFLDEWQFTAEGAAVHRGTQTAVIADVHLGYEWARGTAGDCVLEHSLQDTVKRLRSLLTRTTFRQLIVAGDLLESPWPSQYTT